MSGATATEPGQDSLPELGASHRPRSRNAQNRLSVLTTATTLSADSSPLPLTPRSSHLPLTPDTATRPTAPTAPATPLFADLLPYPYRHLDFDLRVPAPSWEMLPGSQGDETIAPHRRVVQRSAGRWYLNRASETLMAPPFGSLVQSVIEDGSPLDRFDERAGDTGPWDPSFSVLMSRSIKHDGTTDARGERRSVHKSTFATMLRETYARHTTSASPTQAQGRDPVNHDQHRLDMPDLVMTVSSMPPSTYSESRKRLATERKKKLSRAAADPSTLAPDSIPSPVPSATSSIASSRLSLHSQSPSLSGTTSASSKRKRQELIDSLEIYFAIVGLVCELKTGCFFVALCQLVAYIWQLHEVCGTVLGLLANRERFARVIVLVPSLSQSTESGERSDHSPQTHGQTLRIAIETGKREWWGREATMEELDASVYQDLQWLPHRVGAEHVGNESGESPLDWTAIQQLVDFIELARDILKTVPLQGLSTEQAVRHGQQYAAAALGQLDELRAAAGRDAADTDLAAEDEGTEALPRTPFFLGSLTHTDVPTPAPAPLPAEAALTPIIPSSQRTVDLIARGARHLNGVAPPRNVVTRRRPQAERQPPSPPRPPRGGGGGVGGGGGPGGPPPPPPGGDGGGGEGEGAGGAGGGTASASLPLTEANLAALHRERAAKRHPHHVSSFKSLSFRSATSATSSTDLDSNASCTASAHAHARDILRTLQALDVGVSFVSPAEMDRIVSSMSQASTRALAEGAKPAGGVTLPATARAHPPSVRDTAGDRVAIVDDYSSAGPDPDQHAADVQVKRVLSTAPFNGHLVSELDQ